MRFILTSILLLTLIFSVSAQDSLFQLAEHYYQNQEYDKAYQGFKNAGLAFQLDNKFDLYASCNLKMAECLLVSGDLAQAINLAENTHRYIVEVFDDEKDLVSESLMLIGKGHLQTGRNDLALKTLLEAEKNLTSFDDLKAAQCYNELGVIYWNTGNKETALNYHERALAIRIALLDKDNILVGDSHLNLGLIHLKDDFLQAYTHLEKALEIYESMFGKMHPKVALCYSNIAFAHRFQGNYSEALTYLDLTLSIWNHFFSGDHPNKALTFSNKGRVFEEQGNYDQALLMQQEALQQYLRLYGTKHPEVADTYYLIGSILKKKKKYKEAVESFQKSIYANLFDQEYENVYDLPDVRDYYNADILLFSLQYKAQALEALHFEKSLKPRDIESAFETYKKCDILISKIRQLRLNEADKIKIGNTAYDVYDNGIRIALYLADKTFRKEHYRKEAFGFCERSKSAILLGAINETKAKHFAGIPDDLLQMEDSLKAEINWLEQELARDAKAEQVKSRLFEYQRSYRSFISRLETDFPNYFRLKYNEKTLTVEDVRSKLTAGTALLSYFVGSNSVYIFYLTKDGIKAYEHPKKDNLSQLVNGLRNGIKYHIDEAYQASAYELYQQLIPPVGKNIHQLVILPDGILGTIPFESLLMEDPKEFGRNEYLITKYALSYDYAASLYHEKMSAPARQLEGILLSAPIAFHENEIKMPMLPGSEKEVNEIRYLFLSEIDEPQVFLKEKASEASVKSGSLKNFKYLHFATHGLVNESKPSLSRIFLSPDEKEDGSLYSGEIYNLEINADLVTLSACETGLGKVEKGEGIIGLSRSLMYAGAKNLIVSLWQVADESTAQLMIEFYRQHLHHSGNSFFADDLRQAKLSLINDDQYSAPYYWAPFILVGY